MPAVNILDQLDQLQKTIATAISIWAESRDQLLKNGPTYQAAALLREAARHFQMAVHSARDIASYYDYPTSTTDTNA